jgi:formiminoglutamase
MSFLEVDRGTAPLLVSLPHTGTEVPEEILADLVSRERALRDTDWFVHELYGFVRDLGATTVRTRVSRTVIDVNRDPSGASLYPGQATTELCPTTTFDGERLYREGREPDAAGIAARRRRWFDPYHEALTTELERLRHLHPKVVLYDCHSIRSRIPRLFEGELPHLNLGTNAGASCAPALRATVEAACRSDPDFTTVVDGRFKGGWITRRYGRPDAGIHAVQMETAIRAYMDEPPADRPPERLDPHRADAAQGVLRRVVAACLDFASEHPRVL